MPSKDPTTGKRLSGAGQRTLKKTRQDGGSALAVPAAFADLEPPPPTVTGVEAWAAGLAIRAAVAAESAGRELARAIAVAAILKSMGKLRSLAARSAKALELRRLRLREPGVPTEAPISDPVAVPVWAFRRLAELAHEAATLPHWRPDPRLAVTVAALASCSGLPCQTEVAAIVARVRKAE